jgi:hypothetical protein
MKTKSIYLLVFILVAIAYAISAPVSKPNAIASFRQDEFILDTSVTTIPGYGNQLTPVVASDGTNFLLVWAEFRNMKLQIFGARMDQNGILLDTLAIPIATKAETQYAPAVVFGGSYFFVVWEEYHEVFNTEFGYQYPHRIYGSRINTTGVVIDTNAILISNGAYSDMYDNLNPDVAFDGTNYFVAWQGWYGRIEGTRVNQSGAVLGYPIDITLPIEYGSNPCVAFTGSYYLVAWDRSPYHAYPGMICCSRVSTDGVVIDTNAIIVNQGDRARVDPEISRDGQNFFIIWEDYRYWYDTLWAEIYGARVTQAGTVLDTTGINISRHIHNQRTPAISYDGSNYFVVWKDYRNPMNSNLYDIYGARVSRSGNVIDSFGIAITKDSSWATSDIECYPEVAFSSESYLVAWQHGIRAKPAQYDVYTARVLPSGVVVDTSGFAASTQVPGHQYSSVSAFDGTNYLIVWNDYHYGDTSNIYFNQSDYSDVNGVRVSGTGVVLNDAAIEIASAPLDQVNPSIGFDGANYLVVWEDDSAFSYNCELGRIKGTRINSNGVIMDTLGILIAAPYYDHPSISFDGTNYLVVYYKWGQDIACRRVSPSGVVIDLADIVIATGQYPSVGGHAGVAFDGSNFLITWTYCGIGIYGVRVSPSGIVIDPIPIEISDTTYLQTSPAIAFDGANYLVVWEDWRNSTGQYGSCDIYGARVSPGGSVLDPQGIPICTAFNDQECPDVGFDGTNYVVVWQDLRDTTSYNIYGAKVSPAGNVLNTYQVVTDPYDQIEPTITRGNNDQMLITYTGWTSIINSHRAHTMRIWGRMYPFPGVEEGSGMPASGRILRLNAYPNPCRERIEIKWTIPRTNEHVANKDNRKLMIYDVTGRVVKDMSQLLARNSDFNQTTWDMTDDMSRRLPAGVYFVRLEIPGKELVEKVVLIK